MNACVMLICCFSLFKSVAPHRSSVLAHRESTVCAFAIANPYLKPSSTTNDFFFTSEFMSSQMH